jgi:FixJ family two-component response regulator
MKDQTIVYAVDDDPSMRESVLWLCRSVGLNCVTFASIAEFLEAVKPQIPSALVLDLNLGADSGLDVFREWRDRNESGIPVIVVTGSGDLLQAVKGMKLGVLDVLEKPADPQVLLARITEALAADEARRKKLAEEGVVRQRFAQLTARERELLKLLCAGLSNKQVAGRLGLSVKTVANHRAHVIAKTKALNTADMVRLAVLASAA